MTDASPLVEAQQKFVDALPSRAAHAEHCALPQALGRTLCGDVVAPLDSPPYPRVIVEGFLVNAADTAAASEANPVSFTVAGEIKPGDSQCPPVARGQGWRVSTGSIVGDGALAVVRMWEAKLQGNGFTITRPFPPRFFY